MSYVIYEQSTTKIMYSSNFSNEDYGILGSFKKKEYKTMSSARAALTRMEKAWLSFYGEDVNESPDLMDSSPRYRFAIAEYGYFKTKIERLVEKTDMMTGESYLESVNTPPYLSRSCESYWSM